MKKSKKKKDNIDLLTDVLIKHYEKKVYGKNKKEINNIDRFTDNLIDYYKKNVYSK